MYQKQVEEGTGSVKQVFLQVIQDDHIYYCSMVSQRPTKSESEGSNYNYSALE